MRNIKIITTVLLLAGLILPIFSAQAATQESIIQKYNSGQKIRILIVPGHDDQYWGTQYRNIKEADLNISMAQKIISYLSQDKNIQVITPRTRDGYTPTFSNYF